MMLAQPVSPLLAASDIERLEASHRHIDECSVSCVRPSNPGQIVEIQILLDANMIYVYTCIMSAHTPQSDRTLPTLPCACANLRRTARAVTKMYNHELRATGLELTQFTLLMTLSVTGEITQGKLGTLLALDTTSLTRMLRLLTKHGWIGVETGEDRRQRLLRLTPLGRKKLDESRPDWERAQRRMQRGLGEAAWTEMGELLANIARAAEAG